MWLFLLIAVAVIAFVHGHDLLCEEAEQCQGEIFLDITVGNVICSGIASCYGAGIEVACATTECKIECKNTASCKQSLIALFGTVKEVTCTEFTACQSADIRIDIVDAFELKCQGNNACDGLMVTRNTLLPAQKVKISCDGSHACDAMRFSNHVTGTEEMSCKGDHACNGVILYHFEAMPQFELKCEGERACQDMITSLAFLTATTFNSATELKSIKCAGNEACHGMSVSLVNLLATTAVIEELKCEGFAACKHLALNVAVGDWRIKKCICGDPSPYACVCATGLEICDEIEGVWRPDGTDAISCS